MLPSTLRSHMFAHRVQLGQRLILFHLDYLRLSGQTKAVKSAALEAACSSNREMAGVQWAGPLLGVPSCPELLGAP